MSFTMQEIIDRLAVQYDPEELTELLELKSREIAERFDDRILDMWEELQKEFSDD